MSTNATVRIVRKDGTTKGVYLHWDGYIENAGITLQLAYNTAEKVEELLKLGDLSILRYYPEKTDGVDESQVCVAYHRDRGDELRHSDCLDNEFVYEFDEAEKIWYVTKEIYNKTNGSLELGLNFAIETHRTLLIDEIINSGIDEMRGWSDDEFAKSGEVIEACKKKAIEARAEEIKRENEIYESYYNAYYN